MDNSIVFDKIIDFCDDNNIDYCFEVLTYAYKHDLEDWIELLRRKSTRNCISAYLRSKHSKYKTKYKTSMDEAIREMIIAEAEYKSKQYKALCDDIEAMDDIMMNYDIKSRAK